MTPAEMVNRIVEEYSAMREQDEKDRQVTMSNAKSPMKECCPIEVHYLTNPKVPNRVVAFTIVKPKVTRDIHVHILDQKGNPLSVEETRNMLRVSSILCDHYILTNLARMVWNRLIEEGWRSYVSVSRST